MLQFRIMPKLSEMQNNAKTFDILRIWMENAAFIVIWCNKDKLLCILEHSSLLISELRLPTCIVAVWETVKMNNHMVYFSGPSYSEVCAFQLIIIMSYSTFLSMVMHGLWHKGEHNLTSAHDNRIHYQILVTMLLCQCSNTDFCMNHRSW